jgi:uncharacterized protein (DUF2252 family)
MTTQTEDDEHTEVAERQAMGKSVRKNVPRSIHGEWAPAADRPDPISLLQQEDNGRLQHLLPIKYGRMMESPFAFLRGSAVVMAADLAPTPVTGLNVILCGDAHLSNFGIFASPERQLLFDINDFDEAYPGPWEWDVKRLAASAVVAGRDNGFDDKKCRKLARAVARSYRKSMQRFASMSIMETWYYHVDAGSVLKLFDKYAGKSAKSAKKTVQKARLHTSAQALDKMTHMVDGKRQFINSPPLVVRLSEPTSEGERAAVAEFGDIQKGWEEYKRSVPEERRRLLEHFHLTDAALRIGGVGSVGTRCTIGLLEGRRPEDAMILQQKEACPSSLEAYLTKADYPSQAERVVIGQRLMQASSDIFLGRHHRQTGIQFYWRQFKDMKGSFDATEFDPKGVGTYLAVCGHCLARAHARSGDPIAISGYLGTAKKFDKAISKFALTYADQTEKDHQALLEAIKSGQIVAESGV